MAEANFENRTLYQGDNLDFLRGMNSESVDLIATDPPFNKSRDFHATPDSLASGARFADRWRWVDDVQQEWVDQIVDDWPGVWSVIEAARKAAGDDMAAFLCWLGVRLMEMHRILRDDGSLYLHIDHTAHAWVKAMMDGIFGRKNFRNEIVWKRKQERHNLARLALPNSHDSILWYAKGKSAKYNVQFEPYDAEYVEQHYRHSDDRGRYATFPCTNDAGGNRVYEFRGISRAWRFKPERMQYLYGNDLLTQAQPDSPFRYKKYLDVDAGVKADDLWLDFPAPRGKQSTGYPTQKPLALYERIVKASSNPGDMVLDPFAGCATTCVAAERLGRQWIGMDIWKHAHDTVVKRLLDEGLASEEYDPKQPHLLVAGDVRLARRPPERTDEGNVAAPEFRLRLQRAVEPWQRLAHKQMRAILAQAQAMEIQDMFPQAQAAGELVGCAGCGRTLEAPFMELDHITPRADNGDNFITNRILLCGPCNGKKSSRYTLNGLVKENVKDGWMRNRTVARKVTTQARSKAEDVRDNWDSEEIQRLVEWAKGN